ncbi:hypothetical protein D910_08476 [Dendroctonus ponderosae]
MAQQYGVDPQTQRVAIEKLQRKIQLRNEFLKQSTDPFQHSAGEGGAVFDPAFTRYQALGVSRYEYFKPSGKNVVQGLLFFVAPMVIMGTLVYRSRSKAEASYRAGEVAYKDRRFRFS